METLAIFLNDYGLATVLVLLLLTNAGKIASAAERLLSKAWPTFAKQRWARQECITAAITESALRIGGTLRTPFCPGRRGAEGSQRRHTITDGTARQDYSQIRNVQ